jgi:hypothetical protein
MLWVVIFIDLSHQLKVIQSVVTLLMLPHKTVFVADPNATWPAMEILPTRAELFAPECVLLAPMNTWLTPGNSGRFEASILIVYCI